MHDIDKETFEYIQIIKEKIIEKIGLQNIDYCICGSGFKYKDCCSKAIDTDHWYASTSIKNMLEGTENILKYNQHKKIIKKQSIKLFNDIEKYGRLETCIHPNCKHKPIKSHLFPAGFIKTLKAQNYKFEVNGINSELGVDSFRIRLRCEQHDRDLFNKIDGIGDIAKIFEVKGDSRKVEYIQDDLLLGERYLKVLSFKVKTIILDQMYFFIGVLLSFQKPNQEKVWQQFINNYKVYQTILSIFDSMFFVSNNQPMISTPCIVGNKRTVKSCIGINQIYYQTNIVIYNDMPVLLINVVKSGDRIPYIGLPMKYHIKDESILNNLNTIFQQFRQKEDLSGAMSWLEKESFVNSKLYFLDLEKGFFGNSYIYGKY